MHRTFTALAASLAIFGAAAYETPTMGWSSWNTYRVNISDSLIRAQADAMAANGMAGAGYRYINIDDGFFGGRDADGRIIAHPVRFPRGLKPVADHIHSLGLKAGIYSDAGCNTCGNFWDNDTIARGVGFYGHDDEDARFYFVDNGFDFIKIDFCGGDPSQNHGGLALDERERYTAIRRAIDATGRTDVRVNVCRWAFPGTWVHSIGSSWRISPDIQANWNSIKSIIARNRFLSAYAGEGHFNDMDMLEIGRGLSEAEERTHFGMWCIMSSPLLVGCDLTSIPEASLRLITNPELIAINQDSLGLQAWFVKNIRGVEVYVKDIETLHGNVRAVALYNPGENARTVSIDPADLELGGSVDVRDLMARTDLPAVAPGGKLKVTVPAHDTAILRLEAGERHEPTVYEAERAWLERFHDLGLSGSERHAVYSTDAGCSGGACVGWLGNHPENYMEWRDVWTKEGGVYDLAIDYKQWDDRYLLLTVNDGEPLRVDLPVAEPSSDKLATASVRVALAPGSNRIRLANPGEWTADIDRLTLTPVTSSVVAAPSPEGIVTHRGAHKVVVTADSRVVIPSSATVWTLAGVRLPDSRSLAPGVYFVIP